MVDLIPNRGAFVANPSLEDGRGIFTVRRALERAMVLELVGKIDAPAAARLREMVALEAALAARMSLTEAVRATIPHGTDRATPLGLQALCL